MVSSLADVLRALKAERDENTCRKDFALSEAVALGLSLEEFEKKAAKERQAKAGPAEGKGRKPSGSEKFAEPVGRALDKVGEAVGMSRITYQRAKAVVQAAKDAPDYVCRPGRPAGSCNPSYAWRGQCARAVKHGPERPIM